MKIGIDISSLQGPHRMRGIGYTAINFVNHLPTKAKKDYEFVFYMHHNIQNETLDLLDLEGIRFEIRTIYPPTPIGHVRKRVWILKKILSSMRTLWILLAGNQEGANYKDLDWFIQLDQSKPLPAKRYVKSALVIYDLIPYVLENLYLNNYSTARKSGSSRILAFRAQLKRWLYIYRIKMITKRAVKLFAISEHTKNDFIKFIGTKPNKIDVCHLGVPKLTTSYVEPKELLCYNNNPWGDIPVAIPLLNKPFLLFVGGTDPRRKLVELVSAFNILKAQGIDIALVFSGDTMFGADRVGSPDLQKYLNISYKDDIYFLGFTDEGTKNWLYKNALAFVFPSIYEGFGLPVIEAMQFGTPVITYKNSSIEEIAGEAVLYADNAQSISLNIFALLHDTKLTTRLRRAGLAQAEKFGWDAFSYCLCNKLTDSN